MSERRYALVRVGKGDYLLPSHDLQTLWRIRSYLEDGSAFWVDEKGAEHEIRGTFWSVHRYSGTPAQAADDDDLLDPDESDRWSAWGYGFRTRQEAVADAIADGRARR